MAEGKARKVYFKDLGSPDLELAQYQDVQSFVAGGAIAAKDAVSFDVTAGTVATNFTNATSVAGLKQRLGQVVEAPASGGAAATTRGVRGVAMESASAGDIIRVVVGGFAIVVTGGSVTGGDSLCVGNTAGTAITYIITTHTSATDGPFAYALATDIGTDCACFVMKRF